MESNVERMRQKLEIAEVFERKYSSAPGDLDVWSLKLTIDKCDIVLAGEVFGRDGWARKVAWGGSFDWIRKVDGVAVIISDAEANEFDGTPVAKEQFPIQLEDIALDS